MSTGLPPGEVTRAEPGTGALLSWLFSQSHPGHPCLVFLSSYLGERDQHKVAVAPVTQKGTAAGRQTQKSPPGLGTPPPGSLEAEHKGVHSPGRVAGPRSLALTLSPPGLPTRPAGIRPFSPGPEGPTCAPHRAWQRHEGKRAGTGTMVPPRARLPL